MWILRPMEYGCSQTRPCVFKMPDERRLPRYMQEGMILDRIIFIWNNV